MGYPTKVQLIQHKGSEQWYINFPAVLAAAMEFNKGEVVEWVVQDRTTRMLRRREAQKAKRAERGAKKRTVALLPQINALWEECMDGFRQHRTWEWARRLDRGLGIQLQRPMRRAGAEHGLRRGHGGRGPQSRLEVRRLDRGELLAQYGDDCN